MTAAAPLIDSHCHLDMLDDLDAALVRMRDAGVIAAITIGEALASSRWAARAAAARHDVWATVGIHPHHAKDWNSAVGDEIEMLALQPRVVGIGEAGLDYYYDHSPREVQREVFAWHVRLAKRWDRALVIHCRDAFDDVFAILGDEGVPARTVFHCWSGGRDEAERALALGCSLSFSGTVTFKNADAVRAAASIVPVERMLVETDAPFLAPVPHRGRPNEPAFVRATAEFLAAHLGIEAESLARSTRAATERIFGVLATTGTG